MEGKMKRTIFIAGMVLLFVLRIGAQSKPFIGYDKVPWGASIADVREAYGIADTIQIIPDKDDNISHLIQENAGGSIHKREFYFNGGKLYRVWVDYGWQENPQFTLLQSLKTALAQRYGNPTDTTFQTWDYTGENTTLIYGLIEVTFHYTRDDTIYGKFAPDIEVELQYTKAVATSIKAVYSGRPVFETIPDQYVIKVCYTWKKFRDQYEASKLQL
jgi:hypothetical protein